MMKLIFLLLTTLTFAANEPVYIKGQAEATALKLRDLQAPNKQITKTATENFLVETGNKNLLENPSFEHPTVGFGWTDASTNTKSAETTVVIDGKKSLKIELSANDVNLTQTSTLYASQFGGTTQGVASIRIKTDVLVRICTVEAGVTSTTNCLNSSLDNQWHVYKIPFVLGATSNGINIFVDSGTGTVYLDDAFVGAMEVTAVTDASRIAGEAVFPPTSSCIWFRNNAVIGAFASTNACPGPTIVKEYVGDWQTTDANLPQITINALPAGVYKATFYVPLYSSAAAQNSLAINDGTTTCDAVNVHSNTDSGQGVVSCTFHYGVAGNRTFSLYGASSTSLINIENNTSGSATRGTKFQLEYYTSYSTYSSTNADTDWASCNFSTLAWQGLGTVNASKLLCKRHGSDLLVSGRITLGTLTASVIQIPLPLWNGSQLTVGSSLSLATSIGRVIKDSSVVSSTKDYDLLASSGNGFLNVSTPEYSVAISPFSTSNTGTGIFSGATLISIENARIPIEGWQNSNIIIAQLNGLESCASTLDCTDTFSAKVSSTGVVSGENVEWLNGNCTVAPAGTFTCPFNTGIFTQEPNCTVLVDSAANGLATKSASSSSSNLVYLTTSAAGGSATSYAVEVICQKQGVDYVGKTAKAVASDQNISTPGTIKSTLCSAKISSTGVISDQKGGCFASCTNATTPVCTFTSNYWTSGQVPNCWGAYTDNIGYIVSRTSTTSTDTSTLVINTSFATVAGPRSYFCHGERQ